MRKSPSGPRWLQTATSLILLADTECCHPAMRGGEGDQGEPGERREVRSKGLWEEKPLLTGALASILRIVNVPGASDIQTAPDQDVPDLCVMNQR